MSDEEFTFRFLASCALGCVIAALILIAIGFAMGWSTLT